MSLVDLILNIAALLLWFNWRGARFDPFTRNRPATLSGTVRRAEPSRLGHWFLPVILLALLVIRALFYSQLGKAVRWTASLDLGVVSLPFNSDRPDSFQLMLLFSGLSFLQALATTYFWLICLAIINRKADADEPLQKLIRLHLGFVERWPRLVQALLPLALMAMAWMAVHPLLQQARVINPVRSFDRLCLQGILVGGHLYFSLKYLIPAFLTVYLVTSYVYLGQSPLWDFIGMTSRNLLSRLPLQIGRVDLAPLVGIGVVLLFLHVIPRFISHALAAKGLTIWPQ